ncbi:hypothetical protein MMC28_006361 [Mycoblastus sanguinarius]|nr:hypothetical protein [Mycoblastus sanguinarius]
MPLLNYLGLTPQIPKLEPSLTIYIILTAACFVPAIFLGLYYVIDLHSRQNDPSGCRKLGLRIQSHLADEHDSRYSGTEEQNDAATWRVKSLWVYPVKSCRGVELNRGTVISTGMEYDRQFSFAQLSSTFPATLDTRHEEKAKYTWKFITQRGIAAMAMVKTEIWVPDPSSTTYSTRHPSVRSGGVLVIKYPRVDDGSSIWGNALRLVGGPSENIIYIPFNPTLEQIKSNGYMMEDMEIWKDKPKSMIMASTEKQDPWIHELRSYLGITNHLALFRVSKEQPREVFRCAPKKDQVGYQPIVGFQDAYPLHILNLASVHDVERRFEKSAPPLSALNFRPNIIITGGEAYAEDYWKRIKIADYEYYVSCRTVRCLLPNVNPATGKRHASEPNRTLKSFRCIDEGDPRNACLGMQMVPAIQDSKIKVGDTITVLETGEHLYIKQ